MGPRRSGKTSIERVVFNKMSPHETLFLESTTNVRIKEIANNALVQFQILDFPGHFSFESGTLSPERVFKNAGALVYVIDGQDDEAYGDAIDYFLEVAKVATEVNPKLSFDVLIHKVDGDAYLSDDHKIDCQRDIQASLSDEIDDNKLDIHPSFHLTSIYDHTIFEAFSKIVQKLIPRLANLENLLDSLTHSCHIEKAFLFDVVSKIYVATDSNPVDLQTYELCSDMIDVVIDVSGIYGGEKPEDSVSNAAPASVVPGLAYDTDSASTIKLSNSYTLYLREVSNYLALVCLMRNESFSNSSLVEYNVALFRQAITTMFGPQKAGPNAAPSSALAAAAGADPAASHRLAEHDIVEEDL